MQKIHIKGGNTLSGTIDISGAKNSCVALLPAAILSNGKCVIDNVPDISDVDALKNIICELGASFTKDENTIVIDSSNVTNKCINEQFSTKLRASYYFMGVLLGKFHHVEICYPGGCNIGSRPINLHLEGFKKLGANVTIEGNKYIIDAKELKGAFINLDFASVGATINLMFAAVLAEGQTIINNAANEPEIVNIASFLTSMGAKIFGAGTSRIKIIGVKELKSGFTEVIPDRIEAGTYLIVGALLGKNLKINNIIPEHLEALISKLIESGCELDIGENHIIVNRNVVCNPIDVKTQVYPGLATDLGQPVQVYMLHMNGFSTFEETIYENRMQHVKYLISMGAKLMQNGQMLSIMGPAHLNGKNVIATDLRAGAAMVVAGLVADGDTYIEEINHILRGYDNIISKLSNVGANIEIVE